MNENQFDALEQALSDLANGQDAPTLIAANPELASEIEAAQWARSLSEAPIPVEAAHHSRTRVLARAAQLRPAVQPRGWFLQRLPRLAIALVLTLIFLLSWNGLVFASAQALPGDQLYPAKLTLEKLRLGLTLNPQTHQKVEEEYQARRVDEVEQLLALGRVEFVQFLGVVEEQWDDFWITDGIEVRLSPETIILGDILPGITVEVEGATQPEGWVQASEIHLQRFSFNGTVESISNAAWIISGQEVLIAPASIIDPDIEVGDLVNVEVTADDFGILTVRSITLLTSGERESIATETPAPPKVTSPEPTETDQPDETDESDETEEPEESEESDETDGEDETDEPDEADESSEIDETDEPDETDNDEKVENKETDDDKADDSGESEENDKP